MLPSSNLDVVSTFIYIRMYLHSALANKCQTVLVIAFNCILHTHESIQRVFVYSHIPFIK